MLIYSCITGTTLIEFRNNIIINYYNNSELKIKIKNMVKYDKFSKKQSELEDDYVDELTQELFLHLSEMKYDKLIDLHSNQYLFFHCIRFLNNQFNSKN